MYYCLVYYLHDNIDKINKVRVKYDPTFDVVDPHLTIIFPLPSSIGKNLFIKYIENILKKWKPIKIQFGGFRKSWDHWLFLTLLSGESEIIRLSDELYSGLIAEYRRNDIEYIPHVALGLFLENQSQYDLKNPEELTFDEKTYRLAKSESEALELNFQCTIDVIDLLELNSDFTEIKTIKKFTL